MELVKTCNYQGYLVFFDNFYMSPELVKALKARGIGATGTLRVTRHGVPEVVRQLVNVLNRKDVPRGTGYYVREAGSPNVYCCWRDNKCVTVLSKSYPGHAEGTVRRKSTDRSGRFSMADVPLPSAIKFYNKFMGGVDLSDQLIGYHRILRQTKKYWKTLFYHLLEISITNAFILHKWLMMMKGGSAPTNRSFQDQVVLDIIGEYSKAYVAPVNSYKICHGSTAYDGKRRRCGICHSLTSRLCPDCPFSPALCQSVRKDCHGVWHTPASDMQRMRWFRQQCNKATAVSKVPSRREGRPKGSKDKVKRTVA